MSPGGKAAVFSSTQALSGYDNTDRSTGEADAEVFLYAAEGNGGGGKLVCASCNPSGARPRGVVIQGQPTAAQIPASENTLYAPRVLSANGARLFFESFDALVPADTNGRKDVYEWEAPGEGSCTTSSAAYAPSDGGCVYLISSGQSALDSEFIDAGPSGSDVFFATLSSLVPQDFGLRDIYDARIDGGLPVPQKSAECEGEACQPSPQAPAAQTPASSAYRGPGNVKAASPFARCNKAGHRASSYSKRAKALRRNAKKASRHNPGQARRLRHKATRYAKAARKQSAQAKRCRANARKSKRSGR